MSGMTPTQKFVESLRTIRKSRGLSVRQVAELDGITCSANVITDIELGRRQKMSLDDAVSISSALGFSLELMIDGTAPQYDGLPEIVADLVDRLDAITGRDNN